MIEENKNIYISHWLLLITFLVALLIIIGGLTRLTDSGLSITRWDVISGIFPPMSLKDWEESFTLYKQIPEYNLLNSSMSLEQFKTIYWWEYIHRLLGRFVGLFYLIPLFYFTFKKMLKKNSLISLYLILILIFFQGFVGWYMVKSGLTERTDVSHYRLSLHLTLAFIIFILLLWNYLKYKNQQIFIHGKKLPPYLLIFFISCLLIQISIGAFVSGLDAGQIYQSWPLMNQGYYPDDSNLRDLFSMKVFETPSLMQFIHRNIAYFIILLFSFIAIIIYRNEDFIYLRSTALLVFIFLSLQTVLGILTVLSGAQIIIASMHQTGSILLITTSLILVFKNSRIN
jgi:cytochrome c oxidase assembly protein subunit 15